MSKTIPEWFAITREEGRGGWIQFYKTLLKAPLSKPARFFDALENFGHSIMFESVIAASTRNLEGDPLNYVIAIAVSKVNEEIEAITSADRYALNLQKAKQRVELQNEELEQRLRKALGENNEHVKQEER